MRPERAGLRPERLNLRPERLNLRPERPDLRPERLDLRPSRLDLRPERLDLRPERPDFWSQRPDLRYQRPDLRPEGPDEGGQKDEQTNGQMKVPLCSTGLRLPWGLLPKNENHRNRTRERQILKTRERCLSIKRIFFSFKTRP